MLIDTKLFLKNTACQYTFVMGKDVSGVNMDNNNDNRNNYI